MHELVTNIWIFIDLKTELAYNWSGRVYSIKGTDEEKLQILKKLLSTDFTTVSRNAFPDNVKAVINGKELKRKKILQILIIQIINGKRTRTRRTAPRNMANSK
ncbi:MAG: hypothetical protein K0B11_22470 [Mariniphaga sp.]|nr:hypothetical protein [Mariniphaga sp.]